MGQQKIDWRVRYEHVRDYVIAWCRSQDIPVPECPYGTVKKPEGFGRKFDGPKFWPEFKALGHTACDFDKCACRSEEDRDTPT